MYEKGSQLAEQPSHLIFVDEVMGKLKQFGLTEQNEIVWKIKESLQVIRKGNIEKLNAEIKQISDSLIDF